MPLSLHNQRLPFPPKALSILVPFSFPTTSLPSTTLTHLSKYPKLPLNSSILCRASASADTRTLPKSAIQRIAEKLRSLGYVEDDDDYDKEQHSQGLLKPNASNYTSPGEIFVPLPQRLPKYRIGHTLDPSWSTPENPVPLPGSGTAIQRFHELRHGALEEKREEEEKMRADKRDRAPTLAELTLPAEELKRLRTMGIGLKQKLKIGKAGITEGSLNGIHERWRRSEIVRIKCDDLCRMNMKRTHDLLERKTGGLVIWRSGSNIILYRGAGYKYPYFSLDNNSTNCTSGNASLDQHTRGEHSENKICSSGTDDVRSFIPKSSKKGTRPSLMLGVGSPNRVRFQTPGEVQLAEEVDHLLEGLGPRFTDWWGYDPLPVDADLLPAVVPRYRRPFRLLPYGVNPKLTNDEMTVLKRLGRPLPCHFALGRNSKLQGLAAAMIKLWEKCEIAKISVKRGVQNTNSELMAEELKRLTGGILLSRDKEFIVFYRGKDFLPASVSLALEERRKFGIHREKKRADYDSSVSNMQGHKVGNVEFDFQDKTKDTTDQKQKASEQRKLKSTEVAIERTNTKLSEALAKKAQAVKLLAQLENEEIGQEPEMDKEGITEEERFMLRKVGLKMNPFLLLGRRGVFDGTIENMHLHWKYRELVKVIAGGRSSEKVHSIARILEAESGGILVAVERVTKGYAIIVYRGKNYKRPGCLRPQTLLNKKEALKRYIEAQRRESLKLNVLKLSKHIEDLKLQLAKSKETNDKELVKEMELDLIKEKEKNKILSAESEKSDTDLGTNCHSCSVSEMNAADSTSVNSNYEIDSSQASPQITSQDVLGDISEYTSNHENKLNMTKSKNLSEFISKGTNAVMDMTAENKDLPTSCQDGFTCKGQTNSSTISNAGPPIHDVNIMDPLSNSENTVSEFSVQSAVEKKSDRISFRAERLSNRERLILRKQALKMKKRPVFAIGKSNIVTGLAKAIQLHFQKHPLAIVNVKGRAKGTSVKELVFKLEQATGAVFVSQEPSKVILYRGWGAGEECGQTNQNNNGVLRTTSSNQIVSMELLSAIKLECGLHSNQ